MIERACLGLTWVDSFQELKELFSQYSLKRGEGDRVAHSLQAESGRILNSLSQGIDPSHLELRMELIRHRLSVWGERMLLGERSYQCYRCHGWHEGRGQVVLYPKNLFFGRGEKGNVTVPEVCTARLCPRCAKEEKARGVMPLPRPQFGIRHRSMPNNWNVEAVERVTEAVDGKFPPTIRYSHEFLFPAPYFRCSIK
jgi:hypothetical protein